MHEQNGMLRSNFIIISAAFIFHVVGFFNVTLNYLNFLTYIVHINLVMKLIYY